MVPPFAQVETPTLGVAVTPPELFYEVKHNLSRAQLALMARAGVSWIQPGIESLSSPVLKLLRKEVSSHQNLMLLRECRALGIGVVWNYLHGLPGERAEDYAAVAALIPALEHLQPPHEFSRLLVDRFSPYFDSRTSFGIEAVAPLRSYRGLYPRDARLADIAYHFRGRYRGSSSSTPGASPPGRTR
ncbi:MAG: hypothetical protein NDJ94_19615 [Vicinamibacteria bacterium]|nr:hypothetical protein [Vicinamibacteria bacterium]